MKEVFKELGQAKALENYSESIFSKCFSGFVPMAKRFLARLRFFFVTSIIFKTFKANFLIILRLKADSF